MDITRSQLSRSITALQALDRSASPFIGMQWTGTGVAFYRTSDLGYVRSLNYEREGRALVVSLAQLDNALKAITAQQLTLEVDQAGMLRLSATDEYGTSEVRIHTQRNETCWSKTHRPGPLSKQLLPQLFRGINARSYTLALPPVLKNGKLFMLTNSGAITRSGMAESPYPYPRDTFLKALYDLDVKAMALTAEGYWCAQMDGFEIVIAGHRQGDPAFDQYNVMADPIGTLPAARFCAVLDSALLWTTKEHWLRVDFRTGRLETRNAQNDPGEFAFGPGNPWPPFSISALTAKNLAETLKQSIEAEIAIARTTDSIRFTRGLWQLDMRVQK